MEASPRDYRTSPRTRGLPELERRAEELWPRDAYAGMTGGLTSLGNTGPHPHLHNQLGALLTKFQGSTATTTGQENQNLKDGARLMEFFFFFNKTPQDIFRVENHCGWVNSPGPKLSLLPETPFQCWTSHYYDVLFQSGLKISPWVASLYTHSWEASQQLSFFYPTPTFTPIVARHTHHHPRQILA